MLYRAILDDTPAGPIEIIAEDDYIIKLGFRKEGKKQEIDNFLTKHFGANYQITAGLTDGLCRCLIQVDEYFSVGRQSFDLPVKLYGTPFQQKVWAELTRIPYGETIIYHQLAERIGSPKGYRAVGQANHNNPVCIIVPCHRVVGADMTLTGYSGGLDVKELLLRLENPELVDSSIGLE